MFLMTDGVVLDVREMDDDMGVRLQVGRFECLPGAGVTHGFAVEVTRTFPGEYPETLGRTLFRAEDVFSTPLYVSKPLREKLERMLIETCYGVFAWAWYQFYNPGAELGSPIFMALARTGDGFALMLGDRIAVPFDTLQELQAMLPPFGAEGERGYESARAELIKQFAHATTEHRA